MPKEGLPEQIYLAAPRGFCAGVRDAIDILNKVVDENPGQAVFCVNEIVHNRHIVNGFKQRGVEFIKPDGIYNLAPSSPVVFSAHGIAEHILQDALSRGLRTVNAECPLVSTVHKQRDRALATGLPIIYIGKDGHDEMLGVAGEVPTNQFYLVNSREDVEKLDLPNDTEGVRLTQTTLAVNETKEVDDAIMARFPNVRRPRNICFATTNRQEAVGALVDVGVKSVIVVGDENSHNSKMLAAVAEQRGVRGCRISDLTEITPEMYNTSILGITSGASVDERLVEDLIGFFVKAGVCLDKIKELRLENLLAKEPKTLRKELPSTI